MHLLYKFGVGGMEVGIAKLVNALDPATIESSICSSCEADSLKRRLRPEVTLFELDRKPGNDPRFVLQLYRLLKRQRPDVLHTHAWGTLCEGLLAAKLAGIPYVVHGEHGTLQTRPRNVWVQRRVWGYADRVLAVSSRLAERMARDVGFPLERIAVIRNGVDLTRFGSGPRSEVRSELGIRPDELLIGCVGRLVEVKNYPNFLRALAILKARDVRFQAVIAGAGPLHEQLQTLAASLSLANVRFLGNREDVPRLLAGFDVFVLASRSEGLSNVIQEAMATGCPVVATNVGGADELVVDGETGTLVLSDDPGALADAVARMAVDEAWRTRAGVAGRRRAEQLFGLDGMIRDYERMYLGLRGARAVPVAKARPHEV